MKSVVVRISIIVLVVLVAIFLLKGTIYRFAVKYEDGGGRKEYQIKDKTLSSFITKNLPNDESLDANIDIETIIDLSLTMTVQALDFSAEEKESDPQKTFVSGTANYMGYAAFTASVGNYLINWYGLSKEWEAKPKKGKLYLFGNNMYKNAKEGWFKDHDMVIFKNKKTKEEIYVDPIVYDYLGVQQVDKRPK